MLTGVAGISIRTDAVMGGGGRCFSCGFGEVVGEVGVEGGIVLEAGVADSTVEALEVTGWWG